MFVPFADIVRQLGLVSSGSPIDCNLRSTKRHVILEVLTGGDPVCVVKFPRAIGQTFLENEAKILSELEYNNTPQGAVVLPRLLYKGEMFGRIFLVESFLAGGPPPTVRTDTRMARSVIDWTIAVAQVRRRDTLQPAIDDMMRRVVPLYPKIESWVGRTAPEVCALSPTLMHGDLSYNNLLYDGSRVGVVDWEHARLDGFPMTDAIDFLLYDLYRLSRDYQAAANRLFCNQSDPHGGLLRIYCRELGLSAAAVGSLVVLYVLAKLDLLARLEAARAATKARELLSFLTQADLDDVGARLVAR